MIASTCSTRQGSTPSGLRVQLFSSIVDIKNLALISISEVSMLSMGEFPSAMDN